MDAEARNLKPRTFSNLPDALEALQRQYGARGFTVLGFPCNQFGAQEPGDEAEIQAFCRTGYDVSFPLFAVAIRELVETFADKWPDRRGQLSGQLTVIRQDLVGGM